jgi:hypothetical protein
VKTNRERIVPSAIEIENPPYDSSSSSSISLFLCLGGFSFLAGTAREGGGMPMISRAPIRARSTTPNFFFFFFLFFATGVHRARRPRNKRATAN